MNASPRHLLRYAEGIGAIVGEIGGLFFGRKIYDGAEFRIALAHALRGVAAECIGPAEGSELQVRSSRHFIPLT
jgi:hypothetical protein